MSKLCVQQLLSSTFREKELGCKNVIEMDGPYTILKHPTITEGPNAQKVFAFDYSYWSYDTTSHKNNYADQQKIFQDLGVDILNNAFEGIFSHERES
jgi:hypothetical protein